MIYLYFVNFATLWSSCILVQALFTMYEVYAYHLRSSIIMVPKNIILFITSMFSFSSTSSSLFTESALWVNSVYKEKCPTMCLSVRLFTFEVPFKPFKMFRDSEFLEKSNGKKWSQIWILLLINGVKLPAKKNIFWWFSLAKHGENRASRLIRDVW